MARKLNGRDAYDKAVLIQSGKLPYTAQVSLRTRGGSKRAGYMNKMARLSKKTPGQMRGIDSCGPKSKDWLRGW